MMKNGRVDKYLFEGGYAEFLFLVKEGKEEMSNLVK